MLALLALLVQDEVVAVRGATAITVSGGTIENATIVIRNGVIESVTADAAAPDGATTIDATGLTVMPGLIDPYATVSLVGGGGTGNHADDLAAHQFRPADETLSRMARTGYTTLGLYPTRGSISGRMVIVRTGGPMAQRVLVREGPMRLELQPRTQIKDEVRQAIEQARQAIQTVAQPVAEGQPAPPAPEEKVQLLMAVLRGESRLVADARSAAAILHLRQVLGDTTGMNWTIVAGPDIWRLADRLEGVPVILDPAVTFMPQTRDRINPAAELERAGATFALSPLNNSVESHDQVWARLANLVRAGLSRTAALEAVTVRAAERLGIADRVGSIQAGREADLVFLSGDPLEATTRVIRVMIHGETVYEEIR